MDSIAGFGGYIVANAPHLIGFVMPILVEFLNKDVKTSRERFAVTVFACLAAAVLLEWKDLLYGTPDQIIASTGIILAESQVMYKLYFEQSWLRWKIQDTLGVAAPTSSITSSTNIPG